MLEKFCGVFETAVDNPILVTSILGLTCYIGLHIAILVHTLTLLLLY